MTPIRCAVLGASGYAGAELVGLLHAHPQAELVANEVINWSGIDVAFASLPPGRAIVCAAIDSLVKGAAGQAVQNMNLMFDLPETEGLAQTPLFP